ncbi:MAG: hypothetical protein HY737_07040 [Candidatus Omnitrophica bacterium]|nr:hypothetical protein [Candidatus Omnitrophota bacterium]
MKRSGGVTAWAMVLIVIGALTAAGSLFALAIGPRALDVYEAQLRQLDSAPTGDQPGQLPPEEKERALRQLRQALESVRQILSAPAIRMATAAKSALGSAALIAGIGLLMLQGWARTLAIGQAGASILLGLWELFVSPQRQIAEQMMAAMNGLVDAATLAQMRQSLQIGQAVGLGVGLLLLLAWNGVIIWFFNRESVKAQFASAAHSA